MSSPSPSVSADRAASVLAQVMSSPESVSPLYQPIVDLTDRTVVGYEALSRWPTAGQIDPVAVFDHARECGLLGRIEWACRLAAVQGALDAGLGTGHALFVNVESDALDPVSVPAPVRATAVLAAAAAAGIQLVVEFTERTLLIDPATVLDTVDAARSLGHVVALDDVGANDHTLALLPLIAPDIVKLDRSLIQNAPNTRTASIMAALTAHTEHTDTLVLAEGIETRTHLETAQSWGATLGQGQLFGSPAALPTRPSVPSPQLAITRRSPPAPANPTALLDRLHTRVADATLLHTLGRGLEEHALSSREPVTVLATFQTAAQFTPAIAARYRALAARHPFVAVLAAGLGHEPAPGVRGAALAPGDPLTRHRILTIVGHHYCVAVIAREIDDDHDTGNRHFEYALTDDRTLVTELARSLTRSITPQTGVTPRPRSLAAPHRPVGVDDDHSRSAETPGSIGTGS